MRAPGYLKRDQQGAYRVLAWDLNGKPLRLAERVGDRDEADGIARRWIARADCGRVEVRVLEVQ